MTRDYVEKAEGRARIMVPNPEKYRRPDGVLEPAWAPVFYNPRMTFNRDIAILLVATRLSGSRKLRVLDPLAGTGVRGIRLALEVPGVDELVLNDLNPEAYELIKSNVALNGLGGVAEVYSLDANTLMHSMPMMNRKFDYIDVDPFGSPIPFIDSALRALRRGGILAVTATDTAPLTGAHVKACRRRYGALPLRPGFPKEAGLRILVGSIVVRAAAQELAARPLLAYYADYYYRAYFEVLPGAGRCDELLGRMGFALYCPSCGYRGFVQGFPLPGELSHGCPRCGSILRVGGPLWIGPLCDGSLVREMISSLEEYEYLETAARIRRLLETLEIECSIPSPYIRIDELCSRLRINMPSPRLVAEILKDKGYRAVVSHFDPRSIKTDAPIDAVEEAISLLARSPSS